MAPIIDCHIHMYPPEVFANPIAWGVARGEPWWTESVAPAKRATIQGWADIPRLIADMDRAGIERSVMLGWYWEQQSTCNEQNGWFIEWVRERRDRLSAFAAVQPAAGQEALDALQRALDVGLCGIGEILPQAQGSTIRRAMFVDESLDALLNSPEGNEEWEQRIAALRADLEVFVEARTIDPKYLFRLYPARDGIWEIRSVRPAPSIRVLGLFAWKDVFIATNGALREQLGEWQSREWITVKRAAGATWRRLFPTYDPKIASSVQLLVTGALDGKYFKA